MQVTETLSDGLKRAFTVVVPGADIEGKRQAKLTSLGRTLRLPGFRPGKVPMPVVRQRYGSAVMAEVLQESVDEATKQMLSERGLRPADRPKVDLVSFDPASALPAGPAADLEFKLEFELLPDIAMPDFSSIRLTRLTATPDPDTLDKALMEIARRHAELVDVTEERGARIGDTLVVDFAGRVDDVAFPGGAGTDMSVELGASGFIPGFAEQMEGMRPGEQRTIAVTFPDEYGVKDLAGKPASFDITAKALREKVEPVLDDALAVKLGVESLEQLRTLVSQRIKSDYDQLSRLRIRRSLMDALAEKADFRVPDSMVEGEFNGIWEKISASLKDGTADAEDRAKDEATLRTEYRAIAERRVKLGLLLTEIGRVNGIVVSNEELTRAMRREAARYSGQEPQVMEFFRKNPQATESLRGPIFEDKVVDFILELARVEEITVSAEELAREAGEAEPAVAETAITVAESAPDDTAEG